MRGSGRTAVCAVVAGTFLLATAPGPVAALRTLQATGGATDPSGPLVAAVALLAWSLMLWLTVLVALTVAGRLPGMLGRACRALSRRMAPAAVRRAVAVGLGLSLAVGVVGSGSASASPSPASPSPASPSPASPCPVDPSLPGQGLTGRGATGPALGAGAAGGITSAPGAFGLDWTAATGPSLDWTTPTDLEPAGTPPSPASALDWPAGSWASSATDAGPAATTPASVDPIVVRPGDTLWGLAEQSLRDGRGVPPTAAQVAQAWPSWWSANREAVGDDPDLLIPGTPLTPPLAIHAPTGLTTSSTDTGSGADGAGPAPS